MEEKDTTQTLTAEDFREKYGKTPGDELKQAKKKRFGFYISLFIFLIAGILIGLYYFLLLKTEKKIEEVKPDDITFTEEEEQEPLPYYIIDGIPVQEGLKDLYLENKDVRGWIMMPETKVDYPVLQSGVDDPQYYLYRSFDKSAYLGGSIFADAESDTMRPSENVILYGHHMSDGSMFRQIMKLKDKAFYDINHVIWFKTLTGDGRYDVIAAYRTSTHDGDFKFWTYTDMNEEEFTEYVTESKSRTTYEIKDTAQYGDNLISLCTCAYHTYKGKFIVVAKQVAFRQIDTTNPPVAIITTNPDGSYTEEAPTENWEDSLCP